MMRILIGANELELNKGATLELTDKNILFSFDDIACQRTTNITIPATPKNLRILGLSNDFHTDGTMCRQRLIASVVEGLVRIEGYLYISQYNHSARTFSACFVGGELKNLIAIRDAGTLDAYLAATSTNVTSLKTLSGSLPANDTVFLPTRVYECIKRRDGDPRPSSNVANLVARCANHFGVNAQTMTGANKDARIENEKVNGFSEYSAKLIETCPSIRQPSCNVSGFADGVAPYAVNVVALPSEGTLLKTKILNEDVTYLLYCFEALTPIDICITSNLTPGHTYQFIKGEPDEEYQTGSYYGQIVRGYNNVQRGEWYFFDKGDVFCLVDTFYKFNDPHYPHSTDQGYDAPAFQHNYNVKVRTATERELAVGDLVRERDNLPKLTFIELLKLAAALEGKILYYTEAAGFSFVDVSQTDTRKITEITKLAEQTRSIGNFAQNNYVQFNHEGVSNADKVVANYQITNQNIETEKEILTVALSEGELYGSASGAIFRMATDKTPSIYKTNPSTGDQYCTRVSLPRNSTMQALFTSATELTVEARMPLLDYVTLQPTTKILCRNTEWTWREKQWKGGICKLKLVKLN